MPDVQATQRNSKYRRDVDGLRAVAILSVVAFHAFPNLLQGGFIGVDVFFVISGFLISSVIIDNLEANTFSFRDFYQRRIRRIFPALSLVLVACALAGWHLLSAGEYAQLGRHIAGGAGFVANFVRWREAGYFDGSSDTKPLLHLWSLGIEEQFYFIWPFVLWLSWKQRWNIWLVTAILLLASFCANLMMVGTDAVANFYSPLTRIWELLIGAALVGLIAPRDRSPGLHEKLSNPLAAAGLVAIFIAALVLSKDKTFPGWWALLPTLGAASIIAAGPSAWVNRKLLSHPAMVWVGLISYPLYLWHWPILSFLRITGALKSQLEIGICAVGAAFTLSWITYHFIEKPLRSNPKTAGRKTRRSIQPSAGFKTAGLLIATAMAGAIGVFIYQTDGYIYKDRFKIASLPPLPDKSAFEELKIYEHYDRPNNTCRDNLKMSVFREEVCVTNSAAPKVLFLGDSHAMGLYSAIFAERLTVPSVLIASPGCLIYPNLLYKPNGKEWGQDCTAIAKTGLEYAKQSTDIDTVVISLVRKGDNPTSLTNFYSNDVRLTEREVLSAGTAYLIGSLLESGKTVIYVTDIPYFQDTPEVCQSKFLIAKTDQCVVSKSKTNKPFEIYFDLLKELKKKYPALKVFNAQDVVCQDGSCAQHDENQYYYIDKDHLSVYGSEMVLSRLFQEFPMN